MTADSPASMEYLLRLFTEDEQIGREEIREVLTQLEAECESRGIELKEVASGYRYQARQDLSHWLSRLDVERPSRYSRALLETLSLIVYRQPVTRAEIEDVRGVAVSSSIIKTLLEREWVRVVGHRDVPGKPALYGTTRHFLDYFNLKSLSELPPLAELRSLDSIQSEMELKVITGGEAAANAETIEVLEGDASDDNAPASTVDADMDEPAAVAEQEAVTRELAEPSNEASGVNDNATEESDIEESNTADIDDSNTDIDVTEHETETTAALINDEQTDDEDPLAARAG